MKKRGIGMLLPLWVWTLLFVVFPMGYILLLSFVSGDAFGIRYVFTLDNYRRLLSADLLACVVRTLKMSGLTTLFALLAGYPFAYFMARTKKRWRTTLLLLIVIPFWTSALMRMFGWRIFFESNGVFNGVLKWFHDLWYGFLRLFGGHADGMPKYRPVKLLYTRGLVLFGMVYTMLPFMVLPIYSSVEKQDVSLREASRDLGANPFVSFLTVSLPLSLPGAISGCVLVFVPSMGLFFVNQILGGGKVNYLGDLIDYYIKGGRDWALSAAMSITILVLTFLSMAIYRRFSGGDEMGVF